MHLLSCYIENFGTFQQQSFDFNQGLNIFLEDNGWGKSTLAAFLKAMFYGLDYKQRSRDLYERTKYLPWQGGAYGGWLVLESEGRTYKIMRFFGKKGADDTFELYDAVTNRPSADYSASIGEELFGIDRDSFERSIFITPDSKPPALMDSLNAKLGNLIDNTDDINNFESACQTLDRLATDIKAKRGAGGLLGAVEERSAKVRAELVRCTEARQQAGLYQEKIEQCLSKRKHLEDKRATLQDELKTLTLQSRKNEYERLTGQRKEKEREASRLLASLGGKLPTKEEISLQMEEARKADLLSHKLEDDSLSPSEQKELEQLNTYFCPKAPSQEELEITADRLTILAQAEARLAGCRPSATAREEYELLSQKYRDPHPHPQDIDLYLEDYTQVSKLREQIQEDKMELERLKTTTDKAHSFNRTSLLALSGGGILLLCGIAFFLFLSRPAGITCIAAGILLALLGVLLKSRAAASAAPVKAACDSLAEEIGRLTLRCSSLEERYISFLEDIDSTASVEASSNIPRRLSDIKTELTRLDTLSHELEAYQQESRATELKTASIRESCNSFLAPYRGNDTLMDDTHLVALLRDRLSRYRQLQDKADHVERVRLQLKDLEASLTSFLASVSSTSGTSGHNSSTVLFMHPTAYQRQLEAVRDIYRDYTNITEELQETDLILKEFKAKYDISDFPALSDITLSPEDLQLQLKQCDREIAQIDSLTAEYRSKWESQSLLADRQPDLESELENLSGQKADLHNRHRLLLKTMELLQQARDRLSTGYLSATLDAFQRYIDIFDHSDRAILLDTELHTSREENGKRWESGYFSSGYKDLVNICIRLALADAMYHGETPFLILDDPFVNLDDDKLVRALGFLKLLARENQIFYFTCQQSRCPQDADNSRGVMNA